MTPNQINVVHVDNEGRSNLYSYKQKSGSEVYKRDEDSKQYHHIRGSALQAFAEAPEPGLVIYEKPLRRSGTGVADGIADHVVNRARGDLILALSEADRMQKGDIGFLAMLDPDQKILKKPTKKQTKSSTPDDIKLKIVRSLSEENSADMLVSYANKNVLTVKAAEDYSGKQKQITDAVNHLAKLISLPA